MSKRVVRVNGSSGRITVSPGVRSRRKGKNLGTGRDNRQSSKGKPARAK